MRPEGRPRTLRAARPPAAGAQRTGNERRRKPPPSLPRPCWPAAVMSGSPFSLKRLLVCRRGPHAQRRVAPDGVVVLGPGGPRGPDLRPDAELVQRPQLELQRGVPRLDDRAVQRRAGPLPQRWSRRTAEVRYFLVSQRAAERMPCPAGGTRHPLTVRREGAGVPGLQ